MPTVSIHMPEQTGLTGQSLYLRRTSDGTLLNAGGDSLTEDPAGSGRFVATVEETISELMHAAVVSGGLTVRDGWVESGGTIVRDAYPVTDSAAVQAAAAAVWADPDGASVVADAAAAVDTASYVLAALAGACADAGTAAETYAITINGSTYKIDHTGLDSTGNRGTATLSKT